jgi:aminoglycoside phosphotransferase (APT) family kinase protein
LYDINDLFLIRGFTERVYNIMMTKEERETFGRIEPQVRELIRYTAVQKLTKGFSFEEKYVLSCNDTKRYLVRITGSANPEIIRYKQTEFGIIRRLRKDSALVPDAHAFGISDDGNLCFMLLDFIEGTDGEVALNGLGEADQYRIGVQAGEEQKKMHALPAPPGLPGWYESFSEKFARKGAAFDRLEIDVPGIDREYLSWYIRENISSIRDSPRVFLHRDYHPANMVIDKGQLSGIIDFNRYEWGDPVFDFMALAYFSRAISIPFSVGQIDGYTGGLPSREFWKKYALYCAMSIIPDLLWACDYAEKTGSPDEIGRSEKRIAMICADHEGFTTDIPCWYRDCAGSL